MSSAGGGEPGVGVVGGRHAPVQRISYLDRALWDRLAVAASPAELAEFWLELQCCMIDGVARAMVFLDAEGSGDIAPVASWPGRGGDGPNSLLNAAKRAVREQKGVVSGHRPEETRAAGLCCSAYPFVIDAAPRGAVVVEINDRSQEELRAVMRQLQWGAAWIEVAMRRQQSQDAGQRLAKAGVALDLIGLLLEADGYQAACKALVTELATQIDCDLVALGHAARGFHKVVALSHSAEFGERMNLVRSLAAAMEEASDQAAPILFPTAVDGEYRVTLAHAGLSRLLDNASILTIPLISNDQPTGALVFEREEGKPFDQAAIDLCDAVAAAAGPILEQKRRESRHLILKIGDSLVTQARRLFGPHYLGRKLMFGSLAALVVMFSVVEDTYRISAPAKIEGRVQRVIVAPFDGYIASQVARAGDTVRAGSVLAALDDRDLSLEHMRWTTTREQRLVEYEKALAERDRAGTNIVRTQIEQSDAHIALLEEQLKRTELVAPFDGIVVAGDLSQSIGAAVARGDELFQLAPLDAYRVILEVDETQVLEIAPGQTGQLKVASLLDETLPYTIRQITPITEPRDGRNFFRVEAELATSHDRLRPGMAGVGKTDAGTRLMIDIWTRDLLNWLRLKLWAWWP